MVSLETRGLSFPMVPAEAGQGQSQRNHLGQLLDQDILGCPKPGTEVYVSSEQDANSRMEFSLLKINILFLSSILLIICSTYPAELQKHPQF